MSKQMVNCRWDDLVRIEGTERAVTGPGSDWLHYHDCYKLLLEACKAALGDESWPGGPIGNAVVDKLRAALAAAEGETK